ncbi:acetyltransferase [Lacticaseibacillus rhamnosus]|uniref:Acetyltransferase n=1 Tax=Lacticaseibacillus rhamnosus TaxID=47715 RepID=A0AAX0JYY8_LACRH|nr:acetyltransferase [Lacticaseibacillus rhamnosus]
MVVDDLSLRWPLLAITRSPAQGSTCKDLSRNGQSPTITAKATYTPVSKRAGSRS